MVLKKEFQLTKGWGGEEGEGEDLLGEENIKN
jgi:hypothetical protein